MSAAAGPYGFIPVKNPSGQDRAVGYPLASGYGTAIFKNDAAILATTGIIVGAVNSDLIGVFQGCEYTDSTGKPTVSNYWPASTATLGAAPATAWIFDNPNTIYSVQANGSIPVNNDTIGNQADLVVGAGSTSTGMSNQALNSTLGGTGVQKQFRIVELDGDVNNAWGDSFTKVRVQIARHQYIAVKVAI